MRLIVWSICLMLTPLALVEPTHAQGKIFAGQSRKEFCAQNASPSSRSTIVYISTANPGKTDKEKTRALLDSLSLAPREQVIVRFVDDATNKSVQNEFQFCNPSYTKAEIDKLKANTGFWDRTFGENPEEVASEMQARLLEDLTKEFKSREVSSTRGPLDLIRLMLAEGSRLSQAPSGYTRVIFFAPASGGLIDEAKQRSGVTTKTVEDLKKLGLPGLRNLEVFIISPDSEPSAIADNRLLWQALIQKLGGRLWAIGSGFPPATEASNLFSKPQEYIGTWQTPIGRGVAKARVVVDDAGNLRASWVWLEGEEEYPIALDGRYACADGNCSIDAVSAESYPLLGSPVFFEAGRDAVNLTGQSGELKGGIKATREGTKFGKTTAEAAYAIELRRR